MSWSRMNFMKNAKDMVAVVNWISYAAKIKNDAWGKGNLGFGLVLEYRREWKAHTYQGVQCVHHLVCLQHVPYVRRRLRMSSR